ncbi:MAG: DUF4145 domain-containing protein [Rhizobiales bacterium]|nr:DUF4145 domain-containing protein [Hyphomicrobiales bacterium]
MPWRGIEDGSPRAFDCGYCGRHVANTKRYGHYHRTDFTIYICPNCEKPTFFDVDLATPGVPFGKPVEHLPVEIGKLYEEVRRCCAISAFTASVLSCRKILMHIAVEQKAEKDKPFAYYVGYLGDAGYIPPNGKGWVDHIRSKGNEANHEIVLMSETDAKDLVAFTEMLLRFVFEFPNRVPVKPIAAK